jgi:hypothetical protein
MTRIWGSTRCSLPQRAFTTEDTKENPTSARSASLYIIPVIGHCIPHSTPPLRCGSAYSDLHSEASPGARATLAD